MRANVVVLPGNGAPGGTIAYGHTTGLTFVGALIADHITIRPNTQIYLANGLLGLAGADPSYLANDSDNDGAANAGDNCPNAPNVDQADQDQDGFGNVCDNCPAIGNSKQEIDPPSVLGRACTTPAGIYCGNGILEIGNGESCDDGFSNLGPYTPCSRTCAFRAPRITSPLLDRNVPVGGATTFTVDAVGEGTLSYRWSRNGIAIFVSTSNSWTIPSLTQTDTGTYTCEVLNPFGSATTSAALTVTPWLPAITLQPASQTVHLHANATFSVQAVDPGGGSLSYQWYREGQPITGATAPSFTVGDARSEHHGLRFGVIVTGVGGSTYSSIATLSVEVPRDGAGTPEQPYRIVDCDQLQDMRRDLAAHYELVRDVDCAGFHGTPLRMGFSPVGTVATPFTGNFNGAGFAVRNLAITLPNTQHHVGLFGAMNGAQVRDVGLVSTSISGGDFVGAVTGRGVGVTIERAFVTGVVGGGSNVGALAGGLTSSTVRDVYSRANVSVAVSSVSGGLLVGADTGGTYERAYIAATIANGAGAFGGSVGTTQSQVFSDCSVAGHACGGAWRPTSDLQLPATYAGQTPAWDFGAVWGFTTPLPSYPCLRTQPGCGNPHVFEEGNGSAESPFMVSDCATLEALGEASLAHFELSNDIDCAGFDHGGGRGFLPIGSWAKPFRGTLDGNGHVIQNLRSYVPEWGPATLFDAVVGAHILDVGLLDVDLEGSCAAGFACDAVESIFDRVFVTGTMLGRSRAGGFFADGSHIVVRDSYAHADVSGELQVGLIAASLYSSAGSASLFERVYVLGSTVGSPNGDFGSFHPEPLLNYVFISCTDGGTGAPCPASNVAEAALRAPATYQSGGWDFVDTWGFRAPLPSVPCLAFEGGCRTDCGPSDATCNGVDEDCSAVNDDDFVGSSSSCGLGVCMRSAPDVCVNGSVVSGCYPGAPTGTDQNCNGIDENCNGTSDEGYAVATTCGLGVCLRPGAIVCQQGQTVNTCTPGAETGADDTCNGIDDDCDGEIDEHFVPYSDTCGIGACGSSGFATCVGGVLQTTCVPRASHVEICNGIDDDCDNLEDESGVCDAVTPPQWTNGAVELAPEPFGLRVYWMGASDAVGVTEYVIVVTGPDNFERTVRVASGTLGSVLIEGLTPGTAYSVRVDARNAAGLTSTGGPTASGTTGVLPPAPEPEDIAPERPLTATGSVLDAVEFLAEGPTPLQHGVGATAFLDPERVGMATGLVLDESGLPLEGVRVAHAGHLEAGVVYTRADGHFEIVVNGGGQLHLEMRRPGYADLDRTFEVPGNSYAEVPPIFMTPKSDRVDAVTLGTGRVVMATTDAVSDRGVVRQPAVYFPIGVSALARFANGAETPLTSFHVRITEYTVGPNIADRLPGTMPAQIGTTYAADFGVDEVDAMGAESVVFSKPVIVAMEPLFDAPAGTLIPVGAYDESRHEWMPEMNGIIGVVAGVDVTRGVIFDLDGDGAGDDDAAHEGVFLDRETRKLMAAQFGTPGEKVWIVPRKHFTPIDCNWPLGVSSNSERPDAPIPEQDSCADPQATGSTIHCARGTVDEHFAVPGSDRALSLQSDRGEANPSAYRIRFPLHQHYDWEPGEDPDYLYTSTEINVAGRGYEFNNAMGTDLSSSPFSQLEEHGGRYYRTFAWNGRDFADRVVEGPAVARIRVCMHYELTVPTASAPGIGGGGGGGSGGVGGVLLENILFGARGFFRQGVTLGTEYRGATPSVPICTTSEVTIGARDARTVGLLGLELSGVDQLYPQGEVVFRGAGGRDEFNQSSVTTVGGGSVVTGAPPLPYPADGLLATSTQLRATDCVGVDNSGDIYLATAYGVPGTIFKIDRDGVLRRLAGGNAATNTTALCSGLGDDEDSSTTCVRHPHGVTVSPDGSAVYWSELRSSGRWVIRRLEQGRVHLVAGGGSQTFAGSNGSQIPMNAFASDDIAGDGRLATLAFVGDVRELEVAPDGSLYYLDETLGRVRRVTPSGYIETVAGGPVQPLDATLGDVYRIRNHPTSGPCVNHFALSPDGDFAIAGEGCVLSGGGAPSLPVAPDTIYVQRPTGVWETINDSSAPNFGTALRPREGERLRTLSIGSIGDLVFGANGRLAFTDGNYVLYGEAEDGMLVRVAGSGIGAPPNSPVYDHEGSLAANLTFTYRQLTRGPNGDLYFVNYGSARVERISGAVTGVASRVTAGVLQRFNSSGRLFYEQDVFTGRELATYGYDADGRLNAIIEPQGTTVISRPNAGHVVIEAPFGERTHLHDDDADGWVDRIAYANDPSDAEITIEYQAALPGLAQRITRRDGTRTELEFDPVTARMTYDRRFEADGTPLAATHLTRSPTSFSSGSSAIECQVTGGAISLDSLPCDPGYESTDENRVSTYNTVLTRVSGPQRQFVSRHYESGREEQDYTDADGTRTFASFMPNGMSVVTHPDGTRVITVSKAHPVYGDGMTYPETTVFESPAHPPATGVRRITVQMRVLAARDPAGLLATQTTLVNIGGTWHDSSQTFTGGRTWRTAWSRATRTIVRTSPMGRTHTTTLDAAGRPARDSTPGMHDVLTHYDAQHRVLQVFQGVTQGNGVPELGQAHRLITYDYDADNSGNDRPYPETVTTARSAGVSDTTTITFNDLLDPIAVLGPDGETLGLSYDAEQRLSGVTPPSRPEHTMGYSGMDVMDSYTPPQPDPAVPLPTTATTYQQNRDGAVELTTLADGRTIETPRDGTGRITRIGLQRGDIVPKYDPVSGLVSRVDAPGGVTFDVERAGDYVLGMTWRRTPGSTVAENLLPRGGVSFGYDTQGRLSRVGARNAGQTTDAVAATYGYDNDDLLTSVTVGSTTMSLGRRANNGTLETVTVGGIVTNVTPTLFGQLEGLTTTYAENGNPRSYGNTYTYDYAGRIDTRTEDVDGVNTVFDYDYDDAGRLDVVRRNGVVVEDYGYDANGNRSSSLNFEGTQAATYDDQDRLLVYGNRTFTYNAHGQLATMTANGQTTTYSYDELDNLVHVELHDGTKIDYIVDGDGRRLGRLIDGAFDRGWIYGDDREPIAEVNANGSVVASFVYGGSSSVPDLVVRDGVAYRIILDGIGSVRRTIRIDDGATVQRFDYDAWGNVVAEVGDPNVQPFRFSGGIHDQYAGSLRFGVRDYDPRVGRWTTKDALGFDGGDSCLYGFAQQDPVNFHDQSGFMAEMAAAATLLGMGPVGWGIGIGVVIVAGAYLYTHPGVLEELSSSINRYEEHTKGARKSTKAKHEAGKARKGRDREGENADWGRRPPRRRPPGHKGKWPREKVGLPSWEDFDCMMRTLGSGDSCRSACE